MTSPAIRIDVLRSMLDAIDEAKANGTWVLLLAFSDADFDGMERELRTLLEELEAACK